jgi:thioredoxin 1
METHVTGENFEKEVLNSPLPVLLDFWAPWCGPCQLLAPHVEAVAKAYEGKLKVCKLNVDDAQEIATKFTVMNIPTVILFKGGQVMEKRVGVMNKAQLEKFFQSYL